MIAVRLKHLPADSATLRATGGTGWLLSDHLLADIYMAVAREVHPAKAALPKPETSRDGAREKALQSARVRARERQRAIDAGEIT